MLPSLLSRGILPVERLYDIRREMDRLFEGTDTGVQNGAGQWLPPMDVVETKDEILCQIEVPGLSREDLDINIEGNLVTIRGEKKFEVGNDEKDSGYRHFERRYGRFERSFTMPRTVDTDRVSARHENGVLTIVLPKAEQARPRKVAIG